ncbi:MAG: hypothetical protein Q9160_009346 [Pyrenula sp. 1 TL-2023]
MDDHEPHTDDPWDPQCTYMCKRENLVASILQRVRQYGVVVIRATPQVGKTTLLKLLGHRIAHQDSDLEPVYLAWQNNKKREGLEYEKYLGQRAAAWREKNTKIRPHNPAARTIFLIDEAQGSYEEEALWSTLKNYHNTRVQALFVLVCVYGATGVSRVRDPDIESQAQRMHALHRIELRPTMPGSPCMLFRQEEVAYIIRKVATLNQYQLENGVIEYLYRATDGHPGMVGLLISHFENFFKRPGITLPQALTEGLFHNLLVQHEDSFVDFLGKWGRGVWSSESEAYMEYCLQAPQYSHLKLLDIKKALREVAIQPHGLRRSQEDFDAFAFCHKMGFLHTEPSIPKGRGTIFTYASPLHRRVAYRRLFPGLEPDAVIKNLSLLEICSNAIARFSPGTLQNRRSSQSNGGWGIPEPAFQDELYCCLNLELRFLPILSEYSHTKDGQIDFYVSDHKWGIEVLQCGNNTEIAKHIARFATGGNYQKWDIMNDFIILNFCPRSALQRIRIKDEEIRSHVFHVVVEPDELTAEIYSHDKQLYKSWSLSEGRQRVNAIELSNSSGFVFNTDNGTMPMRDDSTQREQIPMEELKEARLQVEREREMRIQTERKIKEMERENKEMRLKIERELGAKAEAQERDTSTPGRGRKRKR